MIRKELQKLRTMRFFIDATEEILLKEGIENLTIRKVAQIAGYNSATIYNYFEDLNHLVFYASLKYLKAYLKALNQLPSSTSNKERFLLIWRCFITESFKYPKFYHNIFFTKYSIGLSEALITYYKIYPEQIEHVPSDLIPMVTESNLYKRNLEFLKKCVQYGKIQIDDLNEVSEIMLLMYESMLRKVISNEIESDLSIEVDKTIKYISRILNS